MSKDVNLFYHKHLKIRGRASVSNSFRGCFLSHALFCSAHGFISCHKKREIKLHLFRRDSKVIVPRAISVMPVQYSTLLCLR